MSTYLLFATLIFLIICSAFFSSSETGLMSINRYRLRHLVRKKNPGALRVSKLLEQPDKLLGIILIGNTFANIIASAVATILAVRLWNTDMGIATTTFILTLVILIFAEITPKIFAALYPEQIAFKASFLLKFLLKLLYPLVYVASGVANGLLQLLRINKPPGGHKIDILSHDELRTLVFEATTKSSSRYQEMLLGILDLGNTTVEDIMIPRNEITGINLNDDWQYIQQLLQSCEHTRLPLYKGSIDEVAGILHLRKVLNLFAKDKLNKDYLLQSAEPVYFIPEGTPLNKQLLQFQQQKIRIGLVVDEYGDILGLVTLEDILEEIVGQFTTNLASTTKDITSEGPNTFLVKGNINIRELNRTLDLMLPTDGPKTLNGLILEYLQTIPNPDVCLKIAGYPLEVLQVEANTVKLVRIQKL